MQLHTLGAVLSLAGALLQSGASVPSPSRTQNPPDVTFTIALKDGARAYRIGEEIDVEFRLTSTTPRRYRLEEPYRGNRRRARLGAPFVVEPVSGTVDPLADLPALADVEGGGITSLEPRFLSETPTLSEGILNESVSFRVPGHYKVTAFSNQVGIPLRSNTLEIDIVAAEPEWATAKLRDAIAVLSGSGACPIVSPRTEDCRTKAARILRFLETREAALALVRRLPDAQGEARDHLRLGLFGSPYRKEILAAMESDMESADVPVDRIWMDTLIDLATVTETGPRPLQPKTFPALDRESELAWAQYQLDDSRYVAAFKPVIKRYYDRLAVAVERKRGQAREVTLQTVRSRPQQ